MRTVSVVHLIEIAPDFNARTASDTPPPFMHRIIDALRRCSRFRAIAISHAKSIAAARRFGIEFVRV